MAIYGMVFLGSTPVGAVMIGWLARNVMAPRAGFAVGGLVAIVAGVWVPCGSDRAGPPCRLRPRTLRIAGPRCPLSVRPSSRPVFPPRARSATHRPVPSGRRRGANRPATPGGTEPIRTPSRSSVHEHSTSTGSSTPPHTTVHGHSSAFPPSRNLMINAGVRPIHRGRTGVRTRNTTPTAATDPAYPQVVQHRDGERKGPAAERGCTRRRRSRRSAPPVTVGQQPLHHRVDRDLLPRRRHPDHEAREQHTSTQ